MTTPIDKALIRESMDIVGSDGARIGTVDRVEGESIRVRRSDTAPADDQVFRYVGLDKIETIDDAVHLWPTADDAIAESTRP